MNTKPIGAELEPPRLEVFGEAKINSEPIKKQYLVLLALIYLKLEYPNCLDLKAGSAKAISVHEISGLLLPTFVGLTVTRRRKRSTKDEDDNITKIRNTTEYLRKEDHAFRAYMSKSVLKDYLGLIEGKLCAIEELACDAVEFVEKIKGTPAEVEEAIAIYDKGKFLGDFESKYGKGKAKHQYEKAKEFRGWVEAKRTEFSRLYHDAKAGNEEIGLEELKEILPEALNVETANAVTVETIINSFELNFRLGEKSRCIEYIEEFIKIYINPVVSPEKNEEKKTKCAMQVLNAIALLSPIKLSTFLRLNLAGVCLADFTSQDALDELAMIGWINIDGEDVITIVNGAKERLLNRLSKNEEEYLTVAPIILNSKAISLGKKYEVLSLELGFAQAVHLKKLEGHVSKLCHDLINIEKAAMAAELGRRFVTGLQKLVTTELIFWYAYALERDSKYVEAVGVLEKKNCSEKEKPDEYCPRCLALEAAALSRIKKGKGNLNRIKELANKVLEDGGSEWAKAEANGVMGKLCAKAVGKNNSNIQIMKIKKHINTSIIIWKKLGEEQRYIGAMSNLATVLEKVDFFQADQAYQEAMGKIQDEFGENVDAWYRVLLNRTMFYTDTIYSNIQVKGLDRQEYINRIDDNINKLKEALDNDKIEKQELRINIIHNIGVYHHYKAQEGNSLDDLDEAKKYYNEALKLARHKDINLISVQAMATASLAEINKDFDGLWTAIDFIKEAKYYDEGEIGKATFLGLIELAMKSAEREGKKDKIEELEGLKTWFIEENEKDKEEFNPC